MNDNIKGIFVSEISAGLQKENGFSGQFVAILDTYFSAFNQPVLLKRSQMMRNQLLTLLKTLGQLRLRWELAHIAVFVEQIENFALQTVGVGRQRWNGEVFFPGVRVELVGERIEANQPSVSFAKRALRLRGHEGGA